MGGTANCVARHAARLASGASVCCSARRARPRRLATVPEGDEGAREALGGARRGAGGGSRSGRGHQRSGLPAPLRVHAGSAPETRAVGRRPAVFSARRGPRSGGDRAARAGRGRTRRSVRRDGGLPSYAAAVSRAARTCLRSRRRARVLRSGHASPRSGRPRVHRAAVVRGGRTLGEAIRRIPLARPGAATSAAGRMSRGQERRRPWLGPVRSPPRDEVFGESRGGLASAG